MTTAVLIPARGGSKGVPDKNIQLLDDRVSLLGNAIEVARAADVGDVWVSTDKYHEHAAAYGARVHDRPAELCGDEATTESAIDDWLGAMRHQPDVVVLLQCTAPFVQPDDIRRCVAALSEPGIKSAFCVWPSHDFAWRDSSIMMEPGWLTPVRAPRQHSKPRLVECGSVYAFDRESYIGNRFVWPWSLVEIHPARHLEIDEPWQLERARKLWK